MTGNVPERLQREKLEACVVHLTPEAVPVMESARRSASNNRMVIYGLLLLVIVIRVPDGLEGLLQRRGARGRRPAGA